MTFAEIAAVIASVIVSIGGAGAIILGFSDWFGKVLAARYIESVKHDIQRDLESFKTKLKKSEFLFEKEFEAASAFIGLRRKSIPNYRHPDMDFHEACEDFALSFSSLEKDLKNYISVHGATLSSVVLDRLSSIIDKAERGQFEVHSDEVSTQGIRLAEEMWEDLQKTEADLCKAVRSQSSL